MLYLLYLNYTVYQEQEQCMVHVTRKQDMSSVDSMKQYNGNRKQEIWDSCDPRGLDPHGTEFHISHINGSHVQ